MPITISGKVRTAPVQRKLDAISQTVTRADVVRQTLAYAAGPTASLIAARTPYRKGLLRRSTGIREAKGRPAIQIGWLEPQREKYGRYVEARRPIVRPTVRQQFGNIADRYALALRQELARFAKS